MKLYRCVVRHRGDLTMTIHRAGRTAVTAAEIVLLKQIHGDDAVVQIEYERDTKRSHREEVERLSQLYGPTAVRQSWPGAAPRLPLTLEEAGLAESPEDEGAEAGGEPGGELPPGVDPAKIEAVRAQHGKRAAAADLT